MTNMSRERREELAYLCERVEIEDVTTVHLDASELRALLSDSAWRERAEQEVRELADELSPKYAPSPMTEDDDTCDRVADQLRAIVDTGRGEGG